MISRDDLIIQVKDVLMLERKNETIHTANKPIHAIGYRLKGEARFFQEGREFTVHAGEFIHVPPDIVYRQKTTGETIIAVHLDVINDNSRDITVWPLPDKQAGDQLFLELLETWNSHKPGYRYEANALVYRLLSSLQTDKNPPDSAEKALLLPSMNYLISHFTDRSLTVPTLAAIANVSEVYFRRVFRQVYQTSPLKYIHRLRVAKAMALLTCGGYSVQNVSAMVGYTDPLYFSRVFKEHTGVTPSQYADSDQQGDITIVKMPEE